MNYAKCMRGLLLTAVMFAGTLFAIDPPQNLDATGGSESIDLNWDGVDGATFYNVYLYDEDGSGGGGECEAGYLEDCSGDGDCCPESWVGDGFGDCEDQAYGCDLTCYDNDGGDCVEAVCGDGVCSGGETFDTCPEDCEEPQDLYPGFDCCDLDFVDCADPAYENYVGTIVDCSGQYCLPAAELGDGVCTDYTDAGYPGVGFFCEELDNDGGDCQSCDEQGLIECPDGSCAATEDECPEVVCTEITDCSGQVLCNEDSVYSSYDCLTPLNCEDVNGDGVIVTWLGDGYCDDGAYGLFFNCEEWSNDCGDCDGTDLGDINGYCADVETCEDQGLVTCDDGSCAADADSCPTCEDQGLLTDCVGTCFDASYLSWIGDGYCDDGTYGIVFTCDEYDNDGGDCDGREAPGYKPVFGKVERRVNFGGVYLGANVGSENTFKMHLDSNRETYTLLGSTTETSAIIEGVVDGEEACFAVTANDDAAGECEAGYVQDCVDADCCPESWIGDGFGDCEDQAYGCDLTCYDNDGGDCVEAVCGDGVCSGGETFDTCPEDCEEPQDLYPGFDCCDLDFVDCADPAYENYVGTIVDCSGQYCLPAAELGDGVCTDYTDAGYPGVGFFCEELDNDGGDCQSCDEQGLIECPDGSCAATEDECPEVVCTEITDCSGQVLCNEDSVYSSYDCLTPLNCEDVNGDGVIVTWLGDGYCDDGAYGLFFNCEEWSNDCGDCDGTDLGDINGYCADVETCEDQGLVTCDDGSCAADADSCPTCEDQGLLTDCVGTCFDASYLSWIGDGYCDDGTYGIVFTCDEYDNDGGDCDGREATAQMKLAKIKGTTFNGNEDLAPKQGAPYHTNGDIREESDYSNIACAAAGASCTSGDVNEDGAINVLDIVNIVNHILDTVPLEDTCAADYNEDGDVNVLDIVNIVNVILGGKTAADATEATLINSGSSLLLKSDGYIGGIEMTLTHGEDFSLELSGNALVSDYATKDGQTKVVIVVPEGEVLFTTTGDYTVADVLVANSSSAVNVNQASKFELSSAYPNPFNPVTSMSFTMPQDGLASVKVYNLMGQQVALLADGNYTQGMHQLTWNASDLSSGVYIVKAIYAGNVSTQKLVLMKQIFRDLK